MGRSGMGTGVIFPKIQKKSRGHKQSLLPMEINIISCEVPPFAQYSHVSTHNAATFQTSQQLKFQKYFQLDFHQERQKRQGNILVIRISYKKLFQRLCQSESRFRPIVFTLSVPSPTAPWSLVERLLPYYQKTAQVPSESSKGTRDYIARSVLLVSKILYLSLVP